MNIDIFLKKKYIDNEENKCINDFIELFNNLYEKDLLLTTMQIKKIIKFLTLGKKKEIILNKWISIHNNALKYLTQKHLLNSKQVAIILKYSGEYPKYNYTWMDNLLKLNYVLTEHDLLFLSINGYDKIFDFNKDPKYIQKYFNNFNYKISVNNVIKKYKIPVDDNIINILLDNIVIYNDTNLNFKLFNKIIELGYKINKNTFYILLTHFNYNKYNIGYCVESSDILINCITDDNLNEIFNILFNLKYITNSNVELLYLTVTKIIKIKNVKPSLEHLKMLIYNNKIEVYFNMDNIYDIFFKDLKYNTTTDFCDMVLKTGNIKLFDYLVTNNIFKISKNSLLYACQVNIIQMIKYLIDMKLVADINCIKSLNRITDNVFNLLVLSGLPINLELIVECYKKKYIIYDLKGIKYDDELYYILYSNFGSAIEIYYYKYMNQNVIYFRELFKKSNIDEIKEYMKTYNLEPDQYCYDRSIIYNNIIVKQWLEDKYNFKPNYLTLVLTEDLENRKKIIDNYLLNGNFNNSIDYKKYYFK